MDYCLNPYGGCSHACVYCYAQFMMRFLRTEGKWGTFVQVKVNFVERLTAQLRRSKTGRVMLSSVTDPYQPVEQRYRLTRSCLELLAQKNLSVSILTKSDLILRDLDLLKEIPDLEVGSTITTTNDEVARFLEPGAPSPSRRFQALAVLTKAGIKTWVFIAPVIPGIADTEENLSAILKKAALAGVREIDYDPLNFYPTSVANLKSLFSRRWPQLLPRLEKACANPSLYAKHVHSLAKKIWPLYGF